MAWGFTTEGQRVLLDVCLVQREPTEDWLDLGRCLTRRGLRSPLLVVSDRASSLVRAITELWPGADRQRCAVHRLRDILVKPPTRPGFHARVRDAYWAAFWALMRLHRPMAADNRPLGPSSALSPSVASGIAIGLDDSEGARHLASTGLTDRGRIAHVRIDGAVGRTRHHRWRPRRALAEDSP